MHRKMTFAQKLMNTSISTGVGLPICLYVTTLWWTGGGGIFDIVTHAAECAD
jgi:hypothetical protein